MDDDHHHTAAALLTPFMLKVGYVQQTTISKREREGNIGCDIGIRCTLIGHKLYSIVFFVLRWTVIR